MGKRREPRKAVAVPVRIFGTDQDGKIFSENVTTVDISQCGAKLSGIRSRLKIDEIIGLTYGTNKVHFRVKWTGTTSERNEGAVGLLNLTPEKPLWDFALPQTAVDSFSNQRASARPQNDRRNWPRVKCTISVELRPAGQSLIWGKASDIGRGGCFVEMPIPLALQTRFEIALWLNESKIHLQGQVASMAPGFGNGVRFLNVPAATDEQLRRYIEAIATGQRSPVSPVRPPEV